MTGDRKPCVCGCGKLAKRGRNYYLGHKPATTLGRLQAKMTVAGSGCWVWGGAKDPQGYGTIRVPNSGARGIFMSAHRAMYLELRGPVPDGLHLDHLCRNPSCINPDHLEAVTPRTNVFRGMSPKIQAHLFNECTRGHELAVNACRRRDGRVVYCRACRREDHAAARLVRMKNEPERSCGVCGTSMRGRRPDVKHCSLRCKSKARAAADKAARHAAKKAA